MEDAEALRELTRRLLSTLGYTVLVAANADQAIQLFDENPAIDVLLTDVVMPGLSGPDLSQQLMKRRPWLKVIYMSGYTDEAIVQHGVLQPGIAFLHKPFTSGALGRKIREAIDVSHSISRRRMMPHRSQADDEASEALRLSQCGESTTI